MATFNDSLDDTTVKSLIAKHGVEKVSKFLDMDTEAPDDQIKAVWSDQAAVQAPAPKTGNLGIPTEAPSPQAGLQGLVMSNPKIASPLEQAKAIGKATYEGGKDALLNTAPRAVGGIYGLLGDPANLEATASKLRHQDLRNQGIVLPEGEEAGYPAEHSIGETAVSEMAHAAKESQATHGGSAVRDVGMAGLIGLGGAAGAALGGLGPALLKQTGAEDAAHGLAARYEDYINAHPADTTPGAFLQSLGYAAIDQAPMLALLGHGLKSEVGGRKAAEAAANAPAEPLVKGEVVPPPSDATLPAFQRDFKAPRTAVEPLEGGPQAVARTPNQPLSAAGRPLPSDGPALGPAGTSDIEVPTFARQPLAVANGGLGPLLREPTTPLAPQTEPAVQQMPEVAPAAPEALVPPKAAPPKTKLELATRLADHLVKLTADGGDPALGRRALARDGIIIERPKLPYAIAKEVGGFTGEKAKPLDPNDANDVAARKTQLIDDGPMPAEYDAQTGEWLKPVRPDETPQKAPSRGLASLIEPPPLDDTFNLQGMGAEEAGLRQMQAENPEGFARQMAEQSRKAQAKAAPEAEQGGLDLGAPEEKVWPEGTPQWKREGFKDEASFLKEEDAYRQQVNDEAALGRGAGGITPVSDIVRELGGIRNTGTMSKEFDAERLGDRRLVNSTGYGMSAEEVVTDLKERGVAPHDADLRWLEETLSDERNAEMRFLYKDGTDSGVVKANKNALKAERNRLTKEQKKGNNSRSRFNENGSVSPGAIVDAAAEAAKSLVEEGQKKSAFSRVADETVASRERRAALGDTVEGPSQGTKAATGFGGSLIRAAPDLVKGVLQPIDAAKRQHLDPLKTIIKGTLDAIRSRSLFKGQIRPEWEAAVRHVEELSPKDKAYITNGKLVSLAADGKIATETLPADLQTAVANMNKVSDHVADAEGIPADRREGNYFPHTFTEPRVLEKIKALDAADAAKVFWNEDGTATITDPYLKERLGSTGYSLDPEGAYLARINAMGRKVYDEPAANKIIDYANALSSSGPDRILKGRLMQFANENYLGKPNDWQAAADEAAMKVFDKLGGDRIRSLAAKGDHIGIIRLMQDKGIIKGNLLQDILPRKGWTKSVENEVVNGIQTSLLGLRVKTIARDTLGRLLNVGDKVGYGNLAKGYVRSVNEGFKGLMNPEYVSALKKAGSNADFENISPVMAGLAESPGFRQAIQHLGMKPLELGINMDRGVAYEAGKLRGAELAKKGLIENTPRSIEQYALGVVSSAVGEHGRLTTNPIFNAPGGRIARMFTSTPAAYGRFLADLANNSADTKIGLGRFKMNAGLARYLLVRGVGATALVNATGYSAAKLTGSEDVKIPGTHIHVSVPGLGLLSETLRSMFPQSKYEGTPGIKGAVSAVKAVRGQIGGDKKMRAEGLGGLGELLGQAATGAVGIPAGGVGAMRDFANEQSTGYAKTGQPSLGALIKEAATGQPDKSRKNAYRIGPLDSLLKQGYVETPPELKYKQRIDEAR